MKASIISVFFCFVFSVFGCSRGLIGTSYSYRYTLENSDSLSFSNDIIKADFSVDGSSVKYTIVNKSSEPIKIIWDDASLTLNGNVEKIIHKGIKYNEAGSFQSPTTIPPKSTLKDLALPINHIYFQNFREGAVVNTPAEWVELPLFPDHDMDEPKIRHDILKQKGDKFSFYLPVEQHGKNIGYIFNFQIADIKAIKEHDNSSERY
jgi:hypothetical protein